jgi:RimJ/RimL family protein N-acetyltransferase
MKGRIMTSKTKPFAIGKQVILRDHIANDIDRIVYWQTHGEWHKYDAPWDGSGDTLTPEDEKKIRSFFLKPIEDKHLSPRKRGMIVHQDGDQRFPEVFYLGINICEDAYLNKGFGTEALKLWINYLFENANIHKIECHTWSLNPRMMHVAKKLHFRLEGREREMIQWQGEWQDRLRYGMLRQEWETL